MADADLCTMRGKICGKIVRKNKKGCRDSIPFYFPVRLRRRWLPALRSVSPHQIIPFFSDGII